MSDSVERAVSECLAGFQRLIQRAEERAEVIASLKHPLLFNDVDTEEKRLVEEGFSSNWIESDLVRYWVSSQKRNFSLCDKIPMSISDTIITEMSFKYGRADIVVFHIDGSASVIEAKDGIKGYNHVVSGIGQASLYSTQLANKKDTVTKIRKALLFSSTGDIEIDKAIESACVNANTIPITEVSLYQQELTFKACKNLISEKLEEERGR